MKVYQLNTKYNEDFVFYCRDGWVTLTTDPKYPYPSFPPLWVKETDTWLPSKLGPGRMTCPDVAVKKKDFNEFMLANIQASIEHAYDTVGDLKGYNLLIFKKCREKGIWRVGMCVYQGKTKYHNKKLQKICDSVLKLKAFW
jgi:hypothetical protein